jgi:cytochrome c peroxidase
VLKLRSGFVALLGSSIALALVACGGGSVPPGASAGPSEELADLSSEDKTLRNQLLEQGVRALLPGPPADPAQVALGQALFFDRELSGNRDVACATCHHPLLHTTDHLAVSLGTGGAGLGPARSKGENRRFIPRNSPDLFTRGVRQWTVLFWDGRVAAAGRGRFTTPAGNALPAGLGSVLAAQAMFPVTSVEEMRGDAGDLDVMGRPNELALIPAGQWADIWTAIMARLLTFDEYQALFAAAYPDVPSEQLSFAHAANAIAAFEIDRWTTLDSPWDRYVAGETHALTADQKRGALLFFGRAACGQCHSGPLLSDQKFHNIAVPQFGPGKGASAPLDHGNALVTGRAEDRFAFRTPALRNVEMTGPWMHNGAYVRLEDAVRHHLDPRGALLAYDASQLDPALQATLRNDAATVTAVLETLDPLAQEAIELSDAEIAQIMAFLAALSDPAAVNLSADVPQRVPSGLPVIE